MKAILKFTLALLLFFPSLTQVVAQEKPVTVGVRVGANMSQYVAKLDPSDLASVNSRVGYMVGLTLDFAFSENIYLLTGADYSQKGLVEYRKGDRITKSTTYIMTPLHFGYKLKIDDNPPLVCRLGPYMGFGIGGKAESKAQDTKTDTFQKGGLKKLDYGMGFGLGTEVNKIAIDLGYNLGLADISEIGEKVRTREYNLTLGYKF